jgi:hypothetical protein
MDLQLSKVYLDTKSIPGLTHFITQLFDIQPGIDDQGETYLPLGNLNIYLIEKDRVCKSGMQFHFQFDSLEELEAFKMKLEFYYYRESVKHPVEFTQQGKYTGITFIDPDGRNWRVEFPLELEQGLHP